MANYNRVIVGGNLTADPELRYTSTGKAVCEFTLAINRRRSASSAEAADYVRVVVWEDLAETIAEHKEKGDGVLVEGRLRHDSWEAEDGQKRSKVTVVARSVQFMPQGSSMRLNRVVIAGNLTRDPVHELVGDGEIAKASFGLAVSRGEDAVDFFDVTAWRGLANAVAEHKEKGNGVIVEGRLHYSTWKKDDKTRSRIEIVAENIDYLGSRDGAKTRSNAPANAPANALAKTNSQATGQVSGRSTAVVTDDFDFEDIPF